MRVGLTGGVGSGKSTVAALLADLGATVIDADAIAREVVERGTPGFDAVVAEFGDGVCTADGDLAAWQQKVCCAPRKASRACAANGKRCAAKSR